MAFLVSERMVQIIPYLTTFFFFEGNKYHFLNFRIRKCIAESPAIFGPVVYCGSRTVSDRVILLMVYLNPP
jgi:hypothetical protein